MSVLYAMAPGMRSQNRICRAQFLRLTARLGLSAALAYLTQPLVPMAIAAPSAPIEPDVIAASPARKLLSHKDFVSAVDNVSDDVSSKHWSLLAFKEMLLETAYKGLLCITLRALMEMGIDIDTTLLRQAQRVYASIVNPADSCSLPQREGADFMDVSSLVGEALSLYLFDDPILPSEKVLATFERLERYARIDYPDGAFLGFKVLCGPYGEYLPQEGFLSPEQNWSGNYQNGGSWLLYDCLALYAAARHGSFTAQKLFLQRLRSETRYHWGSHEYLSTSPDFLGRCVPEANGYGWNAFLANLLP